MRLPLARQSRLRPRQPSLNLRVLGLHAGRLLKMKKRLLIATLHEINRAYAELRVGVVGFLLQESIQLGRCAGQVALTHQGLGQI